MQVLPVQLLLILWDVLADGAPQLPPHWLKEDSVLWGPQEIVMKMKKMTFRTQKTPTCIFQLNALWFFLVKICKKTLGVWFGNGLWLLLAAKTRSNSTFHQVPKRNRFTCAPCSLATYLQAPGQFVAELLLRLLQLALSLEHTQRTAPLAQAQDVHRHFATGPWAWHLLHMPITERRPRASPNALLWQPRNRQGWALISGQLFIT